MLFEKKMEPRCAYCARCTPLDEAQVVCIKKGVVPAGGSCRAFRYDPLLRQPHPPVKLNTAKLSEEDFKL